MEHPWIVVPCYNEARRLDLRSFERHLQEPSGTTLLFVDDGSTDDTAAALAAIAQTNPARCRVIGAARNRGKAEAVRLGLRTALAEGAVTVGYWDADLATPLGVIAEFTELLVDNPEVELVMGSRVRILGRHIDRSGARHVVGRAYATLASIVLGLPVYDTQCGAKLFRRSAALERALLTPFRSRWSFDVELLQRLQHEWGDRGLARIVEFPLVEWRDVGSSHVSIRAGATAFAALFPLLFGGSRSLPLMSQPQPARAGEYQLR